MVVGLLAAIGLIATFLISHKLFEDYVISLFVTGLVGLIVGAVFYQHIVWTLIVGLIFVSMVVLMYFFHHTVAD